MTIKFPDLEDWQRNVLDSHINSVEENIKGQWHIIKSVRQCGKSVLAQLLLIYASFGESDSVSLCISPVISQSRKMYEDVCRIAKKLIIKSNGSTLEITFVNNSKILFRSAEQGDSIRGNTVKKSGILIVDEAAYIKDDIFYPILVPTTNVNKSNIFIFSTPKFKQGFFYDLYVKGLDSGERNIKSFDWTKYDLSKYLPTDLLDVYRQQMPKQAFSSEFLGEFIDGDGAVFTNYKNCIGKLKEDITQPLYISVDWGTGTGNDDTAITLSQFTPTHLNVLKQYYFNDKKTNDTTNYILDIVKMYIGKGFKEINIIVEHNSIGQVYYDILLEKLDEYETLYNDSLIDFRKEIEINSRQFTTTNQSKKRIIEKLTTLFENGRIIIPNDEKLLNQLSLFEAKVNDKGTVTYKGANNSHDDLVMSLCFLCELYEM